MASRKEIQKAIDDLDIKAGGEVADSLHALVTKGISAGLTPKESLRLSDEVVETIYSHAYNLYNRGMYSESGYIFRLLIMLDYTQAKYQMGLAACLHMQKDYTAASQMYIVTAMLSPGNPLPYYHSADCFIQMKSPAAAIFMLQQAIEQANERPEYSILTERCHLMMESLEEEAKEELGDNAELLNELKGLQTKLKEEVKAASKSKGKSKSKSKSKSKTKAKKK